MKRGQTCNNTKKEGKRASSFDGNKILLSDSGTEICWAIDVKVSLILTLTTLGLYLCQESEYVLIVCFQDAHA